MKLSLLFMVFNLLIALASFGQDCKTQAANKPSTLGRGPDAVSSNSGKMSVVEMGKMKPYLAKAENWMKNILTNFTGAKLSYHNNFFPGFLPDAEHTDPMFLTAGIKSHCGSQMMFFAYYCHDNNNTIQTEAESGSSIYIHFNNVFAFGFTSDAGVYTINGKPAFKIIQKKRSEGRIDFYEKRAQNNANAKMFIANDYIILRNSDKPIFIPVTRKEYLQQLLKDVDNLGTSNMKLLNEGYTSNIKLFEAEMKVYKAMDKSYTPEKEAKRRKWFEEDQEKLKKTINKASPDAEVAKALILDYLKKPTEWLNKGFNDFYPNSTYTAPGVSQFVEHWDKTYLNGVGEKEEVTMEEVVTINPAYFNNKLDVAVPQLILVQLRNGTYNHMLKVAPLIKQPSALALLETILNPLEK
jgi:hypothetical protein